MTAPDGERKPLTVTVTDDSSAETDELLRLTAVPISSECIHTLARIVFIFKFFGFYNFACPSCSQQVDYLYIQAQNVRAQNGRSGTSLNHAMTNCKHDDLGAMLDSKFVHQAAHISFYRTDTEIKQGCHLRVATAFYKQFQHFLLSVREMKRILNGQ